MDQTDDNREWDYELSNSSYIHYSPEIDNATALEAAIIMQLKEINSTTNAIVIDKNCLVNIVKKSFIVSIIYFLIFERNA
jgi:hypothetical protein